VAGWTTWFRLIHKHHKKSRSLIYKHGSAPFSYTVSVLDLSGLVRSLLLLEDGRGCHVLYRLVAELQVLLEADRVGDADKDDGRSDQESSGTDTPLQGKKQVSIMFSRRSHGYFYAVVEEAVE
jgi:hypothetical protein